MVNQKIFCIGFQKTGTTSMNTALQDLGFSVKSVFGNDMEYSALKHQYIEKGLALAAEYDAVEDMPWPLLYRELDKAFPNAKFILTVRDTTSWLRSICDHFGSNPDPMQQLTYGESFSAPIGNEDHYCRVYEAHNASVEEYFADRPEDLLVLNLSDGNSWEKICTFIDVPVPNKPFPRSNTKAHRGSIGYRLRAKLQKLRSKFS